VALRNFLIAAGCIALLAGLTLAIIWISRAPATPGGGSSAGAPGILVAARPLAGGTLLQPMDMMWKPVAAIGAPVGAIVRSPATESAFQGAVTRRGYAAGEALTESGLVKSGDRAFLAAVLTPGSRAVSIAVDAPQSVAGLVLPGDRVDLILTQNFGTEAADPGRKSVGETVLRNIRVLAVDQWLMTIANLRRRTSAWARPIRRSRHRHSRGDRPAGRARLWWRCSSARFNSPCGRSRELTQRWR
jgi:pilus assembly protein CpaB